ncbi:hypothetical protein MRX96_010497 [Rhipicephalus microplus]
MVLVGHLGCLMNGRGGDPRAGGDRATVRQAPPFAYASLRMPVTRRCDRPLRPASRKEGQAVVPPSIIIVGAPDAYTLHYSIYLRLYLKVYLLAQSQQEEPSRRERPCSCPPSFPGPAPVLH